MAVLRFLFVLKTSKLKHVECEKSVKSSRLAYVVIQIVHINIYKGRGGETLLQVGGNVNFKNVNLTASSVKTHTKPNQPNMSIWYQQSKTDNYDYAGAHLHKYVFIYLFTFFQIATYVKPTPFGHKFISQEVYHGYFVRKSGIFPCPYHSIHGKQSETARKKTGPSLVLYPPPPPKKKKKLTTEWRRWMANLVMWQTEPLFDWSGQEVKKTSLVGGRILHLNPKFDKCAGNKRQ